MNDLICCKCNEPLSEQKTRIRYLGIEVTENALCCPKCGQVYLSESVVCEKLGNFETTIEEK